MPAGRIWRMTMPSRNEQMERLVKLAAELNGLPWPNLTKQTRGKLESGARALLKIAEGSRTAYQADAKKTPEQRSEAGRKAAARIKARRRWQRAVAKGPMMAGPPRGTKSWHPIGTLKLKTGENGRIWPGRRVALKAI